MHRLITGARAATACAVLLCLVVLVVGCQKPADTGAGASAPAAGGAGATKAADTKATDVKGPIKIGFIVKQPEEPWFQQEWKFAEDCAKEKGFELLKKPGPDGEKVLNEIANLAAAGAQGFIICTPDQKLGPAIVAKAKAAKLKVMSVDDRFVGNDGAFMAEVPHMGISARKIGEAVGKGIWDEFTKRGWDASETGCAAITYKQLETSKERTDGATEVLVNSGFPKDRIFEMEEKTTDVEGSLNAMNILLTQHPDVKKWLIFSMNDEGVLGAVRATEGAGFNADNTIGIGIGGTTAIAEFRREKPTGFFASVLINPYRHGYETAALMYDWITTGKEPPMETYTEGSLETRETLEKTMKERGLLTE